MSDIQNNRTKKDDFIFDLIENFNPKLLYYIFRKSALFIIIIGTVCFIVPFLIFRYSERVYDTNTVLIKKKSNESLFSKEKESMTGVDNNESKINRDLQLITSDIVLDRIVDSLDLEIEYFKNGKIPGNKFEIYKKNPFRLSRSEIKNNAIYRVPITIEINPDNTYSVKYRLGSTYSKDNISISKPYEDPNLRFEIQVTATGKTTGEYSIVFNSKDYIRDYVQNNVQLQINPKQNQSIILSMSNANRLKAETILGKVTSNFLDFDKTENQERVEKSLIFLRDQIDTFNKDYEVSQDTFSNYIERNKIFSPEAQLSNYMANKAELEKNIKELSFQISGIDGLKHSFQKNKNAKNVEFNLAVPSSPDFVEVYESLKKMFEQRKSLLLDYKPEYFAIKTINEQIESQLDYYKSLVDANYSLALKKQAFLNNQNVQNSIELNDFPKKSANYRKIEQESNIKRQFLIDLFEKQSQFLITKSGIVSDYLVVQPPKSSTYPVSPRKVLLFGIGFALFILATILIVLFRYVYFDKIISIKQIENRSKIQMLGIIPLVKEAVERSKKKKNSPVSKVMVLDKSKSKISETFKRVRVNMQYIEKNKFQTIATTSTIPGEGKTFVLINLASVFAMLNKKVIILDLDLRKPRIAKSFNIDNSVGMSTLLSDNCELKECVQPSGLLPNLFLIPSGPIPPNPSELIMDDKFKKILKDLKSEYDYVFIDTPPAGIVNESVEIINKVDVPIYIIRANYSRISFIESIEEIRNQLYPKELYLIVNQHGDGASSYMNDYGYGYGYGYGYKYGKYYEDQLDGYYTKENTIQSNFKQKIKSFFDWKL